MCLASDGGKHARACSHTLGARTNCDEKERERVCALSFSARCFYPRNQAAFALFIPRRTMGHLVTCLDAPHTLRLPGGSPRPPWCEGCEARPEQSASATGLGVG